MRRYNLTHNNEYTFIDVSDNGEANWTTCDNCGALIRYVVTLQDVNNKTYYVGTECVKTLLQCKISNDYSMSEQLKAFKKVAEAQNLLDANNKLKIFIGLESVVLVGLTKSGKPKKIYIERIYDVFLQKYYSFIDSFLDTINKQPNLIMDWAFINVFDYLDSLKHN